MTIIKGQSETKTLCSKNDNRYLLLCSGKIVVEFFLLKK